MASTSDNRGGQTLEVIVVAGTNLKNMALVGTQGTFVELVYGGSKYRTNLCRVKGSSAAFYDKFKIELNQGLRRIKVSVYNRNALGTDEFIGKGKVSLDEVLQKGCQDTICFLYSKSMSAGEVRLMMMYPDAQSSYEEIRVAKEKAEEDLISYINSSPEARAVQLEIYKTSGSELKNMRVKMTEKDEELAILREKMSVLKKELEDANRINQSEEIASRRLAVYELAMKQLQYELTDLRVKLIHSCQGCVGSPVAN